MDFRQLFGGIACIGFGVYSMLTGVLQVGRHVSFVKVDSPGLFWMSAIGLLIAGACFIGIALREEGG